MNDIVVRDHGSVMLLEPLSDEGRGWLKDHVSPEAMWWAGALVVEPRYVADIVNGAREDGLIVRLGREG